MKTLLALTVLCASLLAGCKSGSLNIPNHIPTNIVWTGTNIILERKVIGGGGAKVMALPDGSMARVTKGLAAIVPAPKINPYDLNFSMVCNRTNSGMVWTTNGLNETKLTGIVNVPGPFVVESTNLPTVLKRKGLAAISLLAGPFESIFSIPWQSKTRLVFVDSQNLKAGLSYSMQSSYDLKAWTTRQTIIWTDIDPSAYWRFGRAVPGDTNFVEHYRVCTP